MRNLLGSSGPDASPRKREGGLPWNPARKETYKGNEVLG